MLFDDDDDIATTNSFHEASHPINVNVKETHITDQHKTTPLNSKDHFND